MVAAISKTMEQCWILTGCRCDGGWMLRACRRSSGTRTRVAFDAQWVLDREEFHGDVLGFLHTHPDGPCRPSERDRKTMRAWTRAFGNPMVCVIDAGSEIGAWVYGGDRRRKVDRIVKFDEGPMVIVE